MKRMSDFDDLNNCVQEINQVFIRNGQAKFLDIYDIVVEISRNRCLMALYISFCNEFEIKQDKQTSLFLMKFDVQNGYTWTTCLAQSLFALPSIRILKVTF